MDYATYEALPGVRWSDLKHAHVSPRAYRFHMDGGAHETTDAMRFGTLVHSLVFEPDDLPLRYAIWKTGNGTRATKAYKEFAEAAEADGREVFLEAEYARARQVRDAVHSHPEAAKLLARSGDVEQVIQWTDAETGIACKARMDKLAVDKVPTVIDLKTTKTLDARAFGSTAGYLLYHGQMSHYADGAAEALGLDEPRAALIAAQSAEPFEVAVFTLTADQMWAGSDLAHDLLAKVAECEASGEWPWRYPEALPLELPPWYLPEADEAIRIIEGVSPVAREAS